MKGATLVGKVSALCLLLLLFIPATGGRKYRGVTHRRGRSLVTDDGPLAPMAPKPAGDASCPCLSLEALSLTSETLRNISIDDHLGPNVNVSTFGLGCAPHDLETNGCSTTNDCATIVPLPPDCDKSSCLRSFCYVSSSNCDLLNTASTLFRGRHFSYATCGFMDSFTYTERLKSLRDKTFQVALNSNTGGWKGAYNPSGSFSTDLRWEGPIVNFMRNAALEGGFTIKVTRPPEWLRIESQKFFGSSSFDYCVYAAALGYIDLCIAAYTVTEKRASTTRFFESSSEAIYLIVFKEEGGTSWESFWTAFLTIFQPFTPGVWLLIVMFCLPVLGMLMFYHEYGAPGSAYPSTVPVALQDKSTGQVSECTAVKVSPAKHVGTSIYMAFLAFFQESYDLSVVTIGGKINIIAASSFILLVLAVYTANLAAILSTNIVRTSVENLEEAVSAGYNFCSERKVAQTVIDLHGVDPSLIVPDPPSLGGDSRPGFNCLNCASRSRVFEYMRPIHSDESTYCNAAFASGEDLQVLHESGDHCDKTMVGEVLAFQNTGIPLYEGVADPLLALFHRMKNNGKMESELRSAEPENQCPVQEGEGYALDVAQLTGIWVITFTLAFAALLTWCFGRCSKRKTLRTSPSTTRTRVLQRYDQWGEPSEYPVVIKGKLYDPDSVKTDFHQQSKSIMFPVKQLSMEDVKSELDDDYSSIGDPMEMEISENGTSTEMEVQLPFRRKWVD